jgi:hypothetical protein
VSLKMITGGRKIYARAGEWIVCSGFFRHRVAQLNRDVYQGEAYDESALSNWQQPPPGTGGHYLQCIHCGKKWWEPRRFHFEGGWRD